MSDYKFSVLMSVYHKENPEFFKAALDSNLKNQTLLPDEMVLVCDGPLTEELDAVIEEYCEKYSDVLKVYRLEQNSGLGKALNFGLEKCTYELVARSDSDDICVETRFEEQIDYFKNNADTDIISSFIDEFDEDCNQPSRIKEMPLTHEELVEMAKFRCPINHMAAMFKKTKITEVGSYVHLPYTEDYYLWVRAIVNGARLANVGKVLVHARIGNGMEKRRGNKQYIASWKVLCRYMRENKLIGKWKYFKNMTAVRIFVYMPGWLRTFVYKKILRRK